MVHKWSETRSHIERPKDFWHLSGVKLTVQCPIIRLIFSDDLFRQVLVTLEIYSVKLENINWRNWSQFKKCSSFSQYRLNLTKNVLSEDFDLSEIFSETTTTMKGFLIFVHCFLIITLYTLKIECALNPSDDDKSLLSAVAEQPSGTNCDSMILVYKKFLYGLTHESV